MDQLLKKAVSRKLLRDIDYHFARRMTGLVEDANPHLLLAAALASHRVGEGDVCLDLSKCEQLPLFMPEGMGSEISPPLLEEWTRSLRQSGVVGRPGDHAPLILDSADRLYLGRYWHFEQVLGRAIEQRSRSWSPGVDRERLRQGLKRLFGPAAGTDWQRVAAAMAVLRPFCVISGGPGTGKTRTVTSILALLIEQAQTSPPRIALAAPTGKAAARLTESISAAKASLPLDEEIAQQIPEEAVTLHRLLGFRPGRANPRHAADNPLHLDVLVVDEASMVDLPLMARLFEALPEQSRLILLGDKDQLSSVEAGRVLGDICGLDTQIRYSRELCKALEDVAGAALEAAADTGPDIADHIVILKKSWRFGEHSGIGALARAVNNGNKSEALGVLSDDSFPDVVLRPANKGTLHKLIQEQVLPSFRQVLAATDPESALQALNKQRVLCAVREGPLGVRAINQLIEQAMEREKLLLREGQIYAGRPLMVTANEHSQRLYNGDVGLVLPDPHSNGALRVFFETAEGIRRILPSRLPPHETVYAMTVHKSQGSEFDQVVLILPEKSTRILSRELVYTGITRARQQVELLAASELLTAAIDKQVSRATGLFDVLWGKAAL